MILSSCLEFRRTDTFYMLFLLFIVLITFTAVSQSTWTSQNSGTTTNLNSVTWTGNLFVAAGNSGIILTSPDGVQWSERNSGVSKNIISVCWSGNQLVAVGGCVLTSSDAIQWTQINVDSLCALWEVIWTGEKYIAVGDDIFYSEDGVLWTMIPLLISSKYFDIAYNGKTYVAVGESFAATSSNGVDWKEIVFLSGFGAITWTDSLFVGIFYDNAYISQDGENWEMYKIYEDSNNIHTRSFVDNSIVWTGDLLVAVTYKRIYTSQDAITWNLVKDSVKLNDLCFSDDKFVAVGDSGRILTSPRNVNIAKTPNAIKSNHTILLRLHGNKLNAILPSIFNDNSIRITIYSMSGKIVFENISAINSGKIECDIANLSSGLYTFVARGKGLELKEIFLIEK